jgi:hypothetical protein
MGKDKEYYCNTNMLSLKKVISGQINPREPLKNFCAP